MCYCIFNMYFYVFYSCFRALGEIKGLCYICYADLLWLYYVIIVYILNYTAYSSKCK